jgi:hypothetical protein
MFISDRYPPPIPMAAADEADWVWFHAGGERFHWQQHTILATSAQRR